VGITAASQVIASPLGGVVDRIVATVATVDPAVRAALASLPAEGVDVSVSLTDDVRRGLGELVDGLQARPRRGLAWVWPFPAPGTPPPPKAVDVVAALAAAGALDLPGVRLVHVPACLDPREGDAVHRRWRTRNRYYVDADHQLAGALLFFPELVQLAKPDRCRFCRADLVCDGVAAQWLEQGRTGPLEPM
jgi:hypothetical protein